MDGKWNVQKSQISPCNDIGRPFICKISKETIPPVTPAPQGYCPSGWVSYGSYCYIFITVQMRSYPESSYDCIDRDSNILSILSAAEHEFVKELVSTFPIWIGLQKNSQGSYEWVDESPVGFTSFSAQFQFKEKCVYQSDGVWNDGNCLVLKHRYICKRPRSIYFF